MKNIRIILIAAVVLILAFAGAGIYYMWKTSPDVERSKMQDAKITDISPMLQLCSVEIVEDVPIKAHIGSKHIFARATFRGSISFDLNDINLKEKGDSLLVELPAEIVEIMESTEPGSYEVIDTWNTKLFGSSRFTTAEENSIKAKARDNFRNSIYSRGYVKRARKEAVTNLTAMLHAATGRPVAVTDPTPEGRRNPLKQVP